MRFWQAIVVAQMAAGSVYADRHPDFFERTLAEVGALALGAAAWMLFKRADESRSARVGGEPQP